MPNWIAFISSQLDYIYFFYGFAFIALGVRALTVKNKEKDIDWTFLGWFGLIHGFNEWLDMLAFSLGDSFYFKIVRVVIMLVSFIALGEFGRINYSKIKKRVPGSWIWWVPFILTIIVGRMDLTSIGLHARYLIAFPAAFMAGNYILKINREKKNKHLAFLSILLFAYAVLAGLITSNTWFLNTFLVPIQLLRGICAIWMAITINSYLITQNLESKKMPKTIVLILVIVINVLIAGWFVVEFGGRAKLNDLKNNLYNQTKILGAAINPERVKTLTGTMQDIDTVDYLRIKEQLRWAMEEDLNIQYGYLMKEENNKIISMLMVINKGVRGLETEKDPGFIYDGPDAEYKDYIRNSKSGVFGPYTDPYGTLVTGVVPIIDKSSGKFLALFGMDIEAKSFENAVKKERLQYISILGLIELILLIVLSFTFSMDQVIVKIKKTKEEVEEKVLELEKINKLMVGRELKMIELKAQIKEKCKI